MKLEQNVVWQCNFRTIFLCSAENNLNCFFFCFVPFVSSQLSCFFLFFFFFLRKVLRYNYICSFSIIASFELAKKLMFTVWCLMLFLETFQTLPNLQQVDGTKTFFIKKSMPQKQTRVLIFGRKTNTPIFCNNVLSCRNFHKKTVILFFFFS
jgi:hypothetical protein